jgi:PilZ domain
VADFLTVTEQKDRRWGLRTPARLEAWADPGGLTPAFECSIADLSEGGARVASLTGVPLPDAFALQVNETHEIAEVIWRTKEAVGVRFR